MTHSASAGAFFTIRAETYPAYVWIECQDLGGPWHCKHLRAIDAELARRSNTPTPDR